MDCIGCTYDVLTRAGFVPALPLSCRKIVKASERGCKYILEVPGDVKTALFDVDGYIIVEGAKCDKLVLAATDIKSTGWTEIYVELKGTDVLHAIGQIRTTLENPIFRNSSNRKIKARIVASAFPGNRSNPALEKARREFASKYHCELKWMKNGQKDRL